MNRQDLRPMRRVNRTLREIAMWTSYTMAILCFFAAAICCGDSDYPIKVIVLLMVTFLACMAGFYKLAERLGR